MKRIRRREILTTAALLLGKSIVARAATVAGGLPWQPNAGAPPPHAKPGPWEFFNEAEGLAAEAIADRLIPPDPQTPGGKDAGCAIYIDRQLAGPHGRQAGLYVRGPFQKGTKQQGPQLDTGPAEQYRKGLAALDDRSATVGNLVDVGSLASKQILMLLTSVATGHRGLCTPFLPSPRTPSSGSRLICTQPRT
jgi:gluconate 2-dehydrogenase gamma chain